MKPRTFNVAALCSAVLLGVLLIAWALAVNIDLSRRWWSITPRFNVGVAPVARGDVDVRLSVFSDATFGPMTHGIKLVSSKKSPSKWPRIISLEFAGVYFCHIRGALGDSAWTLRLSLLYLVLAAGVLPVLWLRRRRRMRARGFSVVESASPFRGSDSVGSTKALEDSRSLHS